MHLSVNLFEAYKLLCEVSLVHLNVFDILGFMLKFLYDLFTELRSPKHSVSTKQTGINVLYAKRKTLKI